MKRTDRTETNNNAQQSEEGHTPGMPRNSAEYLEFLTLTLAGLALAFSAFDSGMMRWSIFPIFSRALGILAGASWLSYCLLQGKLTIRHGWLWWPILILWGSMIPQFFTAKDISLAFDVFSDWTSALVLFTVLANFPRDGAARRLLLFAFLASGFIISIFGLNTYASSRFILRQVAHDEKVMYGTFGEEGLVENARQRIESADARGPFPIANSLAGYLGLIIPIQLIVTLRALREKHPRAILVNLFVITVEIICFALTFSKGGYLSLGCGLALMLIFYLPPKIFLPRLKFGAVILAAAALAALLAVFMTNDSLRTKAGHSMFVRGGYWDGAVNIFKNENPTTGIGLGNFVHCYFTHRTLTGSEVLMAHNHYLQLLCDAGIVGLVGFLFFWLVFFRKSSKFVLPNSNLSGNMDSSNRFLLWFPICAGGFFLTYFLFGAMNGWEEWTSLIRNSGTKFLRVLLFLGAPAALGIIWAFYYKTNRNLWAEVSDGENRLLFAAFIGGIGAVLIHSLVDFDLELPSLIMTLAGVAGLALNFSSDGDTKETNIDFTPSREIWIGGTVIVTCLALFFMAIHPGYIAFTMKKASDISWDLKQDIQLGIPASQNIKKFEQWIDTLGKASLISGNNPFVLKESADAKLYFLNNLGAEGIKILGVNEIIKQLKDAVAEADMAATLAPYDPQIRETCAIANDTAFQALKDATCLYKARENYMASVALDPHNPIRLYGLWQFQHRHGDVEAVATTRSKALELNKLLHKVRAQKAIPLGMSEPGMIAGSPLPRELLKSLQDDSPMQSNSKPPQKTTSNGGQYGN